jgi:hypothetical protein
MATRNFHKKSAKSASIVTINNQEEPMGSTLKRPPRQMKTKAAMAAATAATKMQSVGCLSFLE